MMARPSSVFVYPIVFLLLQLFHPHLSACTHPLPWRLQPAPAVCLRLASCSGGERAPAPALHPCSAQRRAQQALCQLCLYFLQLSQCPDVPAGPAVLRHAALCRSRRGCWRCGWWRQPTCLAWTSGAAKQTRMSGAGGCDSCTFQLCCISCNDAAAVAGNSPGSSID